MKQADETRRLLGEVRLVRRRRRRRGGWEVEDGGKHLSNISFSQHTVLQLHIILVLCVRTSTTMKQLSKIAITDFALWKKFNSWQITFPDHTKIYYVLLFYRQILYIFVRKDIKGWSRIFVHFYESGFFRFEIFKNSLFNALMLQLQYIFVDWTKIFLILIN